MKTRLNYYQAAPATGEAITALSDQLTSEFTDEKLKVLVELRVSQINGCAYCIDMHSNQARELGELTQRLDCLSVWREVPFYTDRERAALAWAEAVTLVAQTHVPDDVYAEVSEHFSEKERVQLTAVIGLMNLWNRLSISFRGLPPTRIAHAGNVT